MSPWGTPEDIVALSCGIDLEMSLASGARDASMRSTPLWLYKAVSDESLPLPVEQRWHATQWPEARTHLAASTKDLVFSNRVLTID